MTTRERVGISEFKVAAGPAVLVTYGLGSCLGITLYDPEQRIGGLAHTLLPKPKTGMDTSRMSKFVDSAIRSMADELVAMGAARERLEAKVFGGANMFEAFQEWSGEGIGQRNIASARATLEELEIPLVAEDVGGNFGRTLVFDLESGKVIVKSVREQRETEF
ncbi:MAG: chemotaxis protein CheD [Desulfuromonadales bacterium]|nr:chemotaxis protein CheD [Desulfuromonadales bacterium]NIS42538.1 chemotaxis protein CheD [Desulfuromonadales bacterium]